MQKESGIAPYNVQSGENENWITYFYDSNLLHNYSPESDEWGTSASDRNCRLEISDRGKVLTGPGDDDPSFMTAFNSIHDLPDLLNEIINPHEYDAGYKRFPVTQIVDTFFVSFAHKGDLKVFPFMPEELRKGGGLAASEIGKLITTAIGHFDEKTWLDYLVDIGSWESLLLEVFPEDIHNRLADPQVTDYYLGDKKGLLDFGSINFLSAMPHFGVRLKSKVSFYYLNTVIKMTIEGNEFQNNLISCLKRNLRSNKLHFKMPSSKSSQILKAASIQSLKLIHKSAISELGTLELLPESSVKKELLNRIKMFNLLQKEFKEDFEDMTNPLPHFLAYPIRKFKISVGAEQTKAANQIVNVLAKLPYLLILEELKKTNPDNIDTSDIFVKPMTDGSFFEQQKKLLRDKDLMDSLVTFREFKKLNNRGYIDTVDKLINHRNNSAHAPFDYLSFCSFVQDNIKIFEGQVREAFSECVLVIPREISIENGLARITADKIMGHSPLFEPLEIEVSPTSVGIFETGKLVAFNEHTKTGVTLE